MEEIWLSNYRCFKNKQKVRMAPLTILVGKNSAGKSSFLAIVRALWNLYYNQIIPNFNEDPFDFGAFENIIFSGNREKKTNKGFNAGFRIDNSKQGSEDFSPNLFEVEFEKRGSAPFPNNLTLFNEKKKIKIILNAANNKLIEVTIRTKRGAWKSKEIPQNINLFDAPFPFIPFSIIPRNLQTEEKWGFAGIEYTSISGYGSVQLDGDDWHEVEELLHATFPVLKFSDTRLPYAGSPVRSKPIRTYNPKLLTWDSEGNFSPMYLAHLFDSERNKWNELKIKLEKFGSQADLFDDISIHRLVEYGGGPFEVEIRNSGDKKNGKKRNLIDVGYGVSQILPVLIELLRDNPTPLLLLQQPEVHLHPSAQAALGSLLLQTARKEQFVVVESHSDHLLNRVRLDLRDGVGDRNPEDVSVLYFENSNTDSKIYSLRFDKQGNVPHAPQSYGRFFMDETKRSLRL